MNCCSGKSIKNIALSLILLLMLSGSSLAEQFSGGYGLQYATSARTLAKSQMMVTEHTRAYIWSGAATEYLVSMAGSFNYGLTPRLEGEISLILYQDVMISPDGATTNTPDDIFLRLKYGNRTIGDTPFMLGFSGGLRYQSGDYSNTPMEPEYDSGGHTAMFNVLTSYFRNSSRPEQDLQFHFNLGYTFYNDGETLGDSRSAVKPYFGVQIPLALLSPNMEKLALAWEFHSSFYMSEPDGPTWANSVEDYGYITGTLMWQMTPKFAYWFGLDAKLFQEENKTVIERYQTFPTWRITSKIVWTVNPGMSYIPGGGGFGGFGATGSGPGGQPMGGMYGAANRAALYNWGGAVEGDIQYLEIELDAIREDRKNAEEALKKLKEKIKQKRAKNQQKQSGN